MGWNATAEDTCFVDRSAAVADWALTAIIVIAVAASLGVARACLIGYVRVAVADGEEGPKAIEIHATPSARDAVKLLTQQQAAVNGGI